jgi:uncharacterized membrane protein
MPVCPKCGSQISDGVKFCGACGSSVEPAPNAPAPAPAQPVLQGPAPTGAHGGMAPNIAAMLTYVPLCLIGLVCAVLFGLILEPYKNDRFIRFHAWQSLALHGAFLAFWVGWFVLSAVLAAVARIFAIVTVPISMLVGLGGLILMVVLMIKAYGKESFKLPVIGDWAEKRAGG